MLILNRFKITIALIFGFLLYGISAFLYIKLLEVGHLKFDYVLNQFLIFQITTISISFIYEKYLLKKSIEIKSISQKRIPKIFIYLYFLLCAIVFYFFPWTDDRESKMAQLAGFLRLLWFVLLIDSLNGSKSDYKFLVLNVILMFVDNSRSTFAAILLVHLFRRQKINIFLIGFGIISVFLVASLRSGIFSYDSLFESLFLYGFIGEGINGSLGALQVLTINTSFIESILISTSTFLQPFLVLPKYFLFLDVTKYFDTSHFYTVLVDKQLGEVYYPMAGFYLVSQFVALSYLGSILLLCYVIFCLKIVRILFKNADFAILFTFLLLMMKMSPFTFWKWIIYIFIIKVIVMLLKKIQLNKK